MAKKATPTPPADPAPVQPAAPAMPQMSGMMPAQMGIQPGMGMGMPMGGMGMPQQPMMQQPMGMGGMGMGGQNPMMAMMQMMQMMMHQNMGTPMMDPSAIPFATGVPVVDQDKGLDADIIKPAMLTNRLKVQQGIALGCILDALFLTEDRKNALGGVPKGCTMAFAGPPGKGKTRSALAGLSRVAASGSKVGFVVAEEGFYNDQASGRDDLCSRLVKIGMAATKLAENDFTKKALENIFVLQSQYHRGQTWDDFITKYRYLVEKEEIRFVVIDSLNMLDPTKNRTADNLSALKTYNHEKGVTCICIGQIRDTGAPVGGEALVHTADAVVLIEEMSLGSKEIADFWGGKYRDKIDVVTAVKSVTTPILPYPVRVEREATTGILVQHAAQPADYALLPVK